MDFLSLVLLKTVKIIFMKTSLYAFFLIPCLSFAQLNVDEIKSIDNYAMEACDCVNDLIGELHPKAIEVVLLMAELGEEMGMAELEVIIAGMSISELDKFVAAFERMEDPYFLTQIEDCDGSEYLDEKLSTQIDNANGTAYAYLIYVLTREENCKVMKSLYDLGEEVEE
jgi:hypothetical protein